MPVLSDIHLRSQSFAPDKGRRRLDRAAESHEVEAATEQVGARLFIKAEALKLTAHSLSSLSLALFPHIEDPALSALPYRIEFSVLARPC